MPRSSCVSAKEEVQCSLRKCLWRLETREPAEGRHLGPLSYPFVNERGCILYRSSSLSCFMMRIET